MCDSKRHRSRSPDDNYAKRILLSKIDKAELRTIRVLILRQGIITEAPYLPLERSIDDYAKICSYVHVLCPRKGIPPRVPIFGHGIKVDEVFCNSRTVSHYESGKGTPKQLKKRSVNSERSRSNSIQKSRRSLSRQRRTRSSYKRSDTRRYKSRSRERCYSKDRRNHLENSRYMPRKSRSRSPRSVNRHRDRSIRPLRPGEYCPGHPDLASQNEKRIIRRSYSRSLRPYDGQIEPTRRIERRSSERAVARRRRSRSRRRWRKDRNESPLENHLPEVPFGSDSAQRRIYSTLCDYQASNPGIKDSFTSYYSDQWDAGTNRVDDYRSCRWSV